MTQIILAIIGSGVLSTLISSIFTTVNNNKKHNDGVTQGVRQLLYLEIKERCHKAIKEGRISHEDYEDLKDTHIIYHGPLEGNGYLDGEMSSVDKLERI